MSANNDGPVVYKYFKDLDYTVRSMTKEDVQIVNEWYCGEGTIGANDLEICQKIFTKEQKGLYIGEHNGEVVSSAVRLPWSVDKPGVFYGSFYYVAKEHRGRGYGTMLRDQVARSHVGNGILHVDAVGGKVAKNNEEKFGYTRNWPTYRYEGTSKRNEVKTSGFQLVKASEVHFANIINYDNTCFISSNNPTRWAFLDEWLKIPGGASYVALSDKGDICGFGSRRPCIQPQSHGLGPLYADSTDIATAIMHQLCNEVEGEKIYLNIPGNKPDALKLAIDMDFEQVLDLVHMTIGQCQPLSEKVFGLTSICVCGF